MDGEESMADKRPYEYDAWGRQGQERRGQNGRGTVTMKFHRVLAGVTVGVPADHHHTLVDHSLLLVPQNPQHQFPIRNSLKGFSALQRENTVSNFDAVIAGQPENADGADLTAGGYCRNGMRHEKTPSLITMRDYASKKARGSPSDAMKCISI